MTVIGLSFRIRSLIRSVMVFILALFLSGGLSC